MRFSYVEYCQERYIDKLYYYGKINGILNKKLQLHFVHNTM